MAHITAFHAHRYRGISGLRVDDIARFNVLTGPNGVGKTALLEAIWLFHGRRDPTRLWSPTVQRSAKPVIDPVATLAKPPLHLSGAEANETHEWQVSFEATPIAPSPGFEKPPATNGADSVEPSFLQRPPRGSLRCVLDESETNGDRALMEVRNDFISIPRPQPDGRRAWLQTAATYHDVEKSAVDRFSRLLELGREPELMGALRMILPIVDDLAIVTARNRDPYILATTTHGERLPLQALGQGMMLLFRTLIAMHEAAGGLLLIDEIEGGIHHETLERLWRRLRVLGGERDVQVFAATHSLECVDAAIRAFEDAPEDLAVHSIRPPSASKPLRVVTQRGEGLLAARELNLELR